MPRKREEPAVETPEGVDVAGKGPSHTGEAGVCVFAVAALLFASSFHLLLGLLASFLIPLPVLVLRVTAGRMRTVCVLGGVLAVYRFVLGDAGAGAVLLHFAAIMVLGFVLAELLLWGCPVGRCMALSTLASAAALLIPWMLWMGGPDVSSWQAFENRIQENVDRVGERYAEMGVIPQEKAAEFKESMRVLAHRVTRVFPALTTMSLAVTAWFTLLMVRRVRGMEKRFAGFWDALKKWRAPDPLIWVLIGAGFTLLLPVGAFRIVALNVLLVVLLVYFFQGISIVAYFFERKGIPRFVRWLLYAFIGIQQAATLLVVGVGVIDVWADVRRLEKPRLVP